MRLNRYLASAGLGSRRNVEQIILEGRVRINGHVVTDLSTQVGPDDSVKVGSRLLRVERTLYAVMHKPKGYVCSAEDERERKTIFDLLPKDWPRVHNVGRLDMDSEGILLVTNDGDLTNHLTHPSHEVDKEYEVLLDRPFNSALHREKMLRGFRIQSGFAKCERLDVLHPNHIRLILKQGLNRQIRLMLYDVGGYEVERLMRVRLGTVVLGELPPGEWRFLTAKEVESLREGVKPAATPTTKGKRPTRMPRKPDRRPKPAAEVEAEEPVAAEEPAFSPPIKRAKPPQGPRERTPAPREKAYAPREKTYAPREKTSGPREKAPGAREKAPVRAKAPRYAPSPRRESTRPESGTGRPNATDRPDAAGRGKARNHYSAPRRSNKGR